MSGPDFPEISSVAHSHFEGSQFQRGYHAAQHGDLSVLTRAMGGRSPTELLKQAKRNGKASATDKDKKPAPWITNSRVRRCVRPCLSRRAGDGAAAAATAAAADALRARVLPTPFHPFSILRRP